MPERKIDTREELIGALKEAAELEHSLLIQYLFAAFSAKKRKDEGLTAVQLSRVNSWLQIIMKVALEEMAHLGSVCNLLSAIGSAPEFGRPNFPQTAEKYYPLKVDFTLSRLSAETMCRFVCFEMPVDITRKALAKREFASRFSKRILTDPLQYSHVGDLYSQIEKAFDDIPEQDLLIGAKQAQDPGIWSAPERLNMPIVQNKGDAKDAIRSIIEEGEGLSNAREKSHYGRFRHIFKELQILEANGEFEPARNVVDNPFTRSHRDSDSSIPVNIIKHPDTHKVAETFNTVYAAMLLMLMQYFSYQGETNEQRVFLRNSLGALMSGIIRPLGEVLTDLPLTNDPKEGFAGPGFELHSSLRLSPHLPNRWVILKERFVSAEKLLRTLINFHPRLESISNNIGWLIKNLDKAI